VIPQLAYDLCADISDGDESGLCNQQIQNVDVMDCPICALAAQFGLGENTRSQLCPGKCKTECAGITSPPEEVVTAAPAPETGSQTCSFPDTTDVAAALAYVPTYLSCLDTSCQNGVIPQLAYDLCADISDGDESGLCNQQIQNVDVMDCPICALAAQFGLGENTRSQLCPGICKTECAGISSPPEEVVTAAPVLTTAAPAGEGDSVCAYPDTTDVAAALAAVPDYLTCVSANCEDGNIAQLNYDLCADIANEPALCDQEIQQVSVIDCPICALAGDF